MPPDIPGKVYAPPGKMKRLFARKRVAAIIAVIVACWLDVDAITRVLLIGSVMLVIIVEILNSAIEAVVDRIGS